MKRGDKGPEVAQVQKALNHLGHSAGTVDGHYGGRTERALVSWSETSLIGRQPNELTCEGEKALMTDAKVYMDFVVPGIDISGHQATFDAQQVADDGIKWVCVKSSEAASVTFSRLSRWSITAGRSGSMP